LFFSPDWSGNPQDLGSDYFLVGKERPPKATFPAKKKHFLNERLHRKAGKSSKKNATQIGDIFNFVMEQKLFFNFFFCSWRFVFIV
jgi:hypothetical protein